MQQTGRTVMVMECPTAIRVAVRRQIAGVYVEESGKLGIEVTPEEVMAKFETIDVAPPSHEPGPATPQPEPPPEPTPTASYRRPGRKDPKRVAAGKRAWATRQGRESGTVPPASPRTAAPVVDAQGMTRGERAFATRLRRYRAKHPGMSEEDARSAMMRAPSEGRSAAAEARKKRQTRQAGRGTGRRGRPPKAANAATA
jgi:hypothetical protein